jgi:hypothetical protein
MSKQTITYITESGKSEGCGLNPFCYIWRNVVFIVIMLIIGLILHILFFREAFKKSWPAVEWKELTKENKVYNNKCCTNYGCSGQLQSNSFNSDTNRCCVTERINDKTTKKTCSTVNCQNWLDPCTDCNIKKTFTVRPNGRADGINGSFNKTIVRANCDNLNDSDLGIPTTLYANPDNVTETSTLSKGQKLTGLTIGLGVWWIVAIIAALVYYFTFKAGKAVGKAAYRAIKK